MQREPVAGRYGTLKRFRNICLEKLGSLGDLAEIAVEAEPEEPFPARTESDTGSKADTGFIYKTHRALHRILHAVDGEEEIESAARTSEAAQI